VQSCSQIVTTTKPILSLLQDRCPSCHPTNSVKIIEGKKQYKLGNEKYYIRMQCFKFAVWENVKEDWWQKIAEVSNVPSHVSSHLSTFH